MSGDPDTESSRCLFCGLIAFSQALFEIGQAPLSMGGRISEGEVQADQSEGRREGPRALRLAKAPHGLFAFAGGLAVLGSVVHAGAGFDIHVLRVGPLGQFGFDCSVAAQLVGDDPARCRARSAHSLKEAFNGGLVAPLLQKDVEFDAMLVDGRP